MKIQKNVMIAVLAILVLVVLAVATLSVLGEHKEDKTVIHVAFLPAAQSLPLFVAVEQGMFAKEGLNVVVDRIESPNQIIDALVAGQEDAGAPSVASGITAIVDAKNPDTIRIYSLTCGTENILNDELIVTKDSNISSISELKGKKLAHIPGVQFQTMAKKVLAMNGVNPNEVTLVELAIPNQLTSLASGAVDAVLTLEPTSTLGEFKGVSKLLVANPLVKNVADPWCGGAGVITSSFMNAHPTEAKAFIKVMGEAIKETDSNVATREYLVKYLSLPEAVAKKTPTPLMVLSSDANESVISAYQKFVNVFVDYNVIKSAPDVRTILIRN
ncbi:MAG: ABC transporter substrate-binding protein [archaeon]|jgi:NitT/TauT family transport system substrate-binding protein